MVNIGVFNLDKDFNIQDMTAKYLFDAEQQISHLKNISEAMKQEDYDKKVLNVNIKHSKLQKKLDKVSQQAEQNSRLAGQTKGFFTVNSNLLEEIDKHDAVINSNPRVAKVKNKLDKFTEKNKLYMEAQTFSKDSSNGSSNSYTTTLIQVEGMVTGNKTIAQSIKETEQSVLESVHNALKDNLVRLCKTQNVGFMTLGGENSTNVASRKTINLEKLSLNDLLNAKPGILYVVEKEKEKAVEKPVTESDDAVSSKKPKSKKK